MTSIVQIQFVSKRLNVGGLDWKRIRSFAITGLLVSSVTLAGCQQMGFRSRDSELVRLMAEPDDWELPQSPKSRVPRPNVSELTQGRREVSNTSSREKNYGPNRGNNRNQTAVVAYGTASDHTAESGGSAPNIVSSPYQEMDIEGDLSSLPPAYRAVLKRQLEAFQKRNLSEPASEQPRSGLEKVAPSLVARDNTPPTERGAGKVSTRVTDSDQSSPAITNSESNLAASTPQVPSAANPVTTALATAPPTFKQTDSASANIVQASAVLPTTPSLPNGVSTPVVTGPSTPITTSLSTKKTWSQSLNESIELLEKASKEPAIDENLRISREVTLRLLYVGQRRLKDAMRPIDGLSDGENDYFQHQMQALFEANNPDAMPVRSRHWSLVMNSQREATNHLAAVSNLEVKSVAFCTEVERYGVITKFPKYQFQADQEVLLYCEIENVAATKLKKEGYESQLQGSYEILDSQGRKVADQLLPMEPEICQNHRRDYFIVYKIYMPQQISLGNYQLRLTVEDMKAHKFGQNQLDFQIKK